MRMRQSIAQIEAAFVEEIELDRVRRQRLRQSTTRRARKRSIERQQQAGSLRFFLLTLSMIGTAILVSVLMFKTLAIILG